MLIKRTPSNPDPIAFTGERLVFNGIHGDTGAYLVPPLAPAQLARVARGHKLDPVEHDDIRAVLSRMHMHHRGPAAGIDPDDLAQTGWAVIFPLVTEDSDGAERQVAIREALAPLLDLRRSQAGARHEHYYRELRGRSDAYRPSETKQQFLARLGVGPGPADPERLPYYLLLVGSPEEIPYRVEYQLDVQYAVGRIHFDTIEEYACYARSVVEAETGGATRPRRAAFFGVANAGDQATALSSRYLVEPLVAHAEREAAATGWQVTPVLGAAATKARLAALLSTEVPALLFTASHGIGFDARDPRQRDCQGALLCQDWGGPGAAPTPDMYFAGDDIPAAADLRGLIAFHFACFSTGTPKHDSFSREAFGKPVVLAPHSFIARLPQRLLGRPGGGALAAVGHVDRAWTYSFVQPAPAGEPGMCARASAFESAITSLLRGRRVGHAIEYFDVRYAETASELTGKLQGIELYGEPYAAETLAMMWLEATDARNYAVIGDPAVRLAVAPGPDEQEREQAPDIRLDPDGWDGGGDGDAIQPRDGTPWHTDSEDPDVADEPAATVAVAVNQLIMRSAERVRLLLDHGEIIEIKTQAAPASTQATRDGTAGSRAQVAAITRIGPGGDSESHLPVRNGVLDQSLWTAHLALVEQARAERRELLRLLRALLVTHARGTNA